MAPPKAFPLRGRWHGEAVTDEVLPPSRRSGQFRAPARALSLSPTAPFLPTAEEMGERTPAETTFLHFLSALRLFAAVRFPSRNRRFPDRCRSADCASTAFRCRCLLLRQILFVLPCRRLRNNYILCPTGTPTFAAARRQRRDLIIAQPQGAVSKGGGRSPLLCRFKGIGSLRKGGNSKSPFP